MRLSTVHKHRPDWRQFVSIYYSLLNFFQKMGQSLPLFVYFHSFLTTISLRPKWKKHRWSDLDSNLGPQDGRRRRNHGAMSAALSLLNFFRQPFDGDQRPRGDRRNRRHSNRQQRASQRRRSFSLDAVNVTFDAVNVTFDDVNVLHNNVCAARNDVCVNDSDNGATDDDV